MEFYKNAVELRCVLSGFVMQEKYIPKKWRPILAYPTVNLLNTMIEHIIAANGIYPYSGGKLDHELLHRRKELQAQAVADCEALFDCLQFIMDEFHFSRLNTGLDMGIAPQNQEVFQLSAGGAYDDGTDSHVLYVVARIAYQKAGPPICSLYGFAVL